MKKSCILIVLLSLSACVSAPVKESDNVYKVPSASYDTMSLYDEYTTDTATYGYPAAMENGFYDEYQSSPLLQQSRRIGTTPHMQIARPVPTPEEMEPQPIVVHYSSSAEGRP